MPTVVAQPYSTAGNGGRKLVRLSNGNLISVVIDNANKGFRVYKSVDNGVTWTMLVSLVGFSDFYSLSVVPMNNDVGILIGSNQSIEIAKYNGDTGALITNKVVDLAQTSINNVSLAIDPTNGHLHAAWASKNATYPNSFNIRYAKSTDGGVTWSTVVTIGGDNTTGTDSITPVIVVRNGLPLIIYNHNYSSKIIGVYRYTGTAWINSATVIHNGGSYAQSSPSAVVDKDGVIHVAWHGMDSTYTTNDNIKYSKSTDGGVTWSSAILLTTEADKLQRVPSITADKNGIIDVVWHGRNIYSSVVQIRKRRFNGSSWLAPVDLTTNTTNPAYNPSVLYDPTFAGQFGTTPPTIYMDTQAANVQYIGTYTTNNAPTITLNTTDNQTLYENDTLTIDGSAIDNDADQSVTVYYQINNDAQKVLATDLSKKTITFNKSLVFKNGKLLDGEAAVSSALVDGVPHTLKVWAQDSNGAESTIATRSFYVVPNRAPSLTIDAVVPSGNINTDKFTISGNAGDPDANANVKVTYRINSNNSVEVYNGTGGAFSFEIALSQLIVGQNTIVVEVVDNYGAKYSKTIKLNKNEVKTPLLKSTARYKIEPPSGSAKGVLLWIQRSENLVIDAKISMGLVGEAENFVAMSLEGTAPVSAGIVEDEFFYETAEAKDNIILELELTRTSTEVNDTITLISGVLE